MSVQETMERKLDDGIPGLLHLEILNESNRHNVPPGSESHFKLVLVSATFAGKTLLARHRLVNGILAEELSGRIHALSIHAYTDEEWRARMNDAPMSPPCMGGGKVDKQR